MGTSARSELRGWSEALTHHPLGTLIASLAAVVLLYYATSQAGRLPLVDDALQSLHAVECMLFIVPMALASFAFGRRAGLLVVAISFLLMLPRALWLSPHPGRALLEAGAAALVGWVLVLVIASQQREQALHRTAAARLHAANAVSASAAGSVDFEQVLADALDRAMDATGFETGLILLTNRRTRGLALRAYRGISEQSASCPPYVLPMEGPLQRVLRSPEPMILQDVSSDLPALQGEGIRTEVLAPLRSMGSAQGILALGTRTGRQPEQEELDFIMAIANRIGVAVDIAHLYREAGRRLQAQTHLNQLAERIVSKVELDKIIPAVLRSARELTGADEGGIALGDREGGRGFCTISLPSDPKTGPIQVERAVDQEVMQSRRPMIVEDYPSYHGAIRALVNAGLANLIAVPIVYGDELLGTLTLFNFDASKRFAEWDVAVVVELGRQTGIAIENARLYESTRFYVRQVTRAQEDERRRIARELHDETIQRLVVISRRLESLSVLSDQLPADARERIVAVEELLRETMQGVRRFVHDLRPPMLDHLGLVASVEALASDLRENNAIDTVVQVVGTPRRLEPEEELVLFRIAQEALGNARRHSGATEVGVRMDFGPDQVQLSVSDNGCGFDVPGRIDGYVAEKKLGLIGMSERARTLGGMLDIRSESGHGAEVTVKIPSQRLTESEANLATG